MIRIKSLQILNGIYLILGTRISGRPEQFGLCSLSLFINYFFFIALNIWIMILSRAWYTSFQESTNKTYPRRSRNHNLSIAGYNIGTNFIHISAWTVSVLLAIMASVIGQDNDAIDGNSYIGICFISHRATKSFAFFVCIPLIVMLIVLLWSCAWSFKSLSGYIRTAKTQPMSKTHMRQFKFHRMRLLLFITPISIFVLYLLVTVVYDSHNSELLYQSERQFLISKMKESVVERVTFNRPTPSHLTTPKNRQNMTIVLLQTLIQPLCFIIISTLVVTCGAFRTWKRLCIKLYEIVIINKSDDINNKIELQPTKQDADDNHEVKDNEMIPNVNKLQLMALAWAKRYDVQRTNQLSISLPDDEDVEENADKRPSNPIVVGVLESFNETNKNREDGSSFNSITEFNDFTLALPRLVQRRNGYAGARDLGLKSWGSIDSNLHLSRTVSIRSSRIGGYSLNSRRSSFIGSRQGNGESIQSAYQSELSEYLYSLHRDSLRKSKTSAMSFVKRFSKRSVKSKHGQSSNDVSLQNSVESDDNNATILPAITINQEQSNLKLTNNTPEDIEDVKDRLNQIKSRLQDKQLKVPGPGNSINIAPLTKLGLPAIETSEVSCSNFDNKNVVSSRETYLSEGSNENLDSTILQKDNFEQVGVQTSLTDLSELGKVIFS